MKLSVISTLKPFKREYHWDWHQESALLSWSLHPNLEVVIVGADDESGRQLADRHNFKYVPDVLRAYDVGYYSQAPMLHDLLAKGLNASSNDWVCLLNSDIIVLPDFEQQCQTVLGTIDLKRFPSPFITVRRLDFTMDKPLLTQHDICLLPTYPTTLCPPTGSDLFMTTKAFWLKILETMPPFITGRFIWDPYFHRRALFDSSQAIDATQSIKIYHPFHGRNYMDPDNPEVYYNLTLYEAQCGSETFSLSDPRWVRL